MLNLRPIEKLDQRTRLQFWAFVLANTKQMAYEADDFE
jgi:hypothetical protein